MVSVCQTITHDTVDSCPTYLLCNLCNPISPTLCWFHRDQNRFFFSFSLFWLNKNELHFEVVLFSRYYSTCNELNWVTTQRRSGTYSYGWMESVGCCCSVRCHWHSWALRQERLHSITGLVVYGRYPSLEPWTATQKTLSYWASQRLWIINIKINKSIEGRERDGERDRERGRERDGSVGRRGGGGGRAAGAGPAAFWEIKCQSHADLLFGAITKDHHSFSEMTGERGRKGTREGVSERGSERESERGRERERERDID